MKLEIGRTYYILTYADSDFTMPGVEPVVYIGKNAYMRCLEDDRDTHQFQDATTYVRFGPVTGTSETEFCRVEAFAEEELGVSVMSLEAIAEAIAKSLVKAEKLGEPVLSVSRGKWFTASTKTWVPISAEDNVGPP